MKNSVKTIPLHVGIAGEGVHNDLGGFRRMSTPRANVPYLPKFYCPDSPLQPPFSRLALTLLLVASLGFSQGTKQSKPTPRPADRTPSSPSIMTTRSGYKLELLAKTFTTVQPDKGLNALLGGKNLLDLVDYAINSNQDIALVGHVEGATLGSQIGFIVAKDKLILAGDTVDGVTIKEFGNYIRLNNRGSVAFSASIARGTSESHGIFLNDKLVAETGKAYGARSIMSFSGEPLNPTFSISDQDDFVALAAVFGQHPFAIKNGRPLEIDTHGEAIEAIGMNPSGEIYYVIRPSLNTWMVCKLSSECTKIDTPNGVQGNLKISNTGVVVYRGAGINPGLPEPYSMNSQGFGVQPWARGILLFDVSKWDSRNPTAAGIVIGDPEGSERPMVNDLRQVLYISKRIVPTNKPSPLGVLPTTFLKLATPLNVKSRLESAGR